MAKDIGNNLVINYLPQFMTDEEFKNMFLSIGLLKSYKVVRDKTTGFSYGFGFVEYEEERDAERAMKVFDGHHMMGKRVRVQPANKQDQLSMGHNLYVKNIPSNYTETELDRMFESYGKIVTSKVLMDLHTGQSRNVGFVLFDTKAMAEKAIADLNGTTPAGFTQSLVLKFADEGSSKKMKSLQTVVPQISPQTFKQPFMSPNQQGNGFRSPSPTGGPMRTQNTNRFRFNPIARDNGPNFQNNAFQNQSQNNNSFFGAGNTGNNNFAQGNFNAMSMNNMNMNNNMGGMNSGMNSGMNTGMNSGMANTQNIEIPSGSGPFSLFVFNIGDDAEERELWAMFSPFGTVQKCTVMMDTEKKHSKGYGFVDMANSLEAVNAIKSLNGFFYKGRQLNVSFKSKKKD